jgi:leucyl/phenylalanyl-tRNA--protein transferase
MNEQGLNIRWIKPDAAPDAFPDPCEALTEPNGLLAIGGDLSAERLLAAYRHGIFPWFSDGQPILWWTPDPRAVLFPTELKISRSLTKTLRKNIFMVSVDQAFGDVISECAERGTDTGTWITPDMTMAYIDLHERGHAHSIETWRDGELVGGLYGVNIGRVFFAESMFYRATDASKTALAGLTALCRATGIELIDCQVASGHLSRLGSRELPRLEFNRLLTRLTAFPAPVDWPDDPVETSRLLDKD